jgi:hypothetical protein
MSDFIISARVTNKDMDFLNANYPKYKKLFPGLEFDQYVGVVIHQGIRVLKEEPSENT